LAGLRVRTLVTLLCPAAFRPFVKYDMHIELRDARDMADRIAKLKIAASDRRPTMLSVRRHSVGQVAEGYLTMLERQLAQARGELRTFAMCSICRGQPGGWSLFLRRQEK
jgi:hypothetical protein